MQRSLHLMSAKRYKVELTLDQRKELERLVKTGAPKTFTRLRARIWLRVDQGPHGPADIDQAAAAVWAQQAWVQEGMNPKFAAAQSQ